MRRDQFLGMTEYLNSDMDDIPMDETDLSGFMSTNSAAFGDVGEAEPRKVVTRTRPSAPKLEDAAPPEEMGYVALSDQEGMWSPINPFYAHDEAIGHPYVSIAPKIIGTMGLIYFGSKKAVSRNSEMVDPNINKWLAVSTGLYLHPTLGWNNGLVQNVNDTDAWWWSAAKLAVHTGGAYMLFVRPLRG